MTKKEVETKIKCLELEIQLLKLKIQYAEMTKNNDYYKPYYPTHPLPSWPNPPFITNIKTTDGTNGYNYFLT